MKVSGVGSGTAGASATAITSDGSVIFFVSVVVVGSTVVCGEDWESAVTIGSVSDAVCGDD